MLPRGYASCSIDSHVLGEAPFPQQAAIADEGKEPSAVPGTDASADVPSAALPAEPQLAEGQPSAAVAGGGAEADGGREHAEEDEERQLEARKQERQRKNT